MARAAWREPNLPAARLDEPTRRLRLLVDHCDELVAERRRVQCRLRWHLHEIDPMLEVRPRGLRHGPAVSQVAERMADVAGPVAEIAHELLARCTEHNLEFEAGAEVTTWMKAASPACPLKGRGWRHCSEPMEPSAALVHRVGSSNAA